LRPLNANPRTIDSSVNAFLLGSDAKTAEAPVKITNTDNAPADLVNMGAMKSKNPLTINH